MKEIELVKQNTETLGKILKSHPPAVEKIEVILQILNNFEYLKKNLKADELNQLSSIEEDVKSYLDKITNPDSMQGLIDKINDYLKS